MKNVSSEPFGKIGRLVAAALVVEIVAGQEQRDAPTVVPTLGPGQTRNPTSSFPTNVQTNIPTSIPTDVPTEIPTNVLTDLPSPPPSNALTSAPSNMPPVAPPTNAFTTYMPSSVNSSFAPTSNTSNSASNAESIPLEVVAGGFGLTGGILTELAAGSAGIVERWTRNGIGQTLAKLIPVQVWSPIASSAIALPTYTTVGGVIAGVGYDAYQASSSNHQDSGNSTRRLTHIEPSAPKEAEWPTRDDVIYGGEVAGGAMWLAHVIRTAWKPTQDKASLSSFITLALRETEDRHDMSDRLGVIHGAPNKNQEHLDASLESALLSLEKMRRRGDLSKQEIAGRVEVVKNAVRNAEIYKLQSMLLGGDDLTDPIEAVHDGIAVSLGYYGNTIILPETSDEFQLMRDAVTMLEERRQADIEMGNIVTVAQIDAVISEEKDNAPTDEHEEKEEKENSERDAAEDAVAEPEGSRMGLESSDVISADSNADDLNNSSSSSSMQGQEEKDYREQRAGWSNTGLTSPVFKEMKKKIKTQQSSNDNSSSSTELVNEPPKQPKKWLSTLFGSSNQKQYAKVAEAEEGKEKDTADNVENVPSRSVSPSLSSQLKDSKKEKGGNSPEFF